MRSVNSVGFLVFPDMLQLDFTGPYAVFSQLPDVALHLIGKTRQPVVSSDKLAFAPTASFDEDPAVDILVVPGGGGVAALMADEETLAFIRRKAATCAYVASVCTGALVLGAAGLLKGRSATTHWQSLDFIACFGGTPVRERVVFDGNLVSAAGVSAGIDMALALAGRVWGDETAQAVQLGMEYSPCPPYDSGTPETAPETVRRAVVEKTAQRQAARKAVVAEAAKKLGLENISFKDKMDT